MTLIPSKSYRMSFSVGGLMVNESIALVRHCNINESWAVARDRLMGQGISSFPKLASRTRILKEVFDRIQHLSVAEREYLLEDADRTEQLALIWLAICRTYRFVREFAVEVIHERYQSWRLTLGHESFDRFLAEKADIDPAIAKLSSSTCAKLRQVLFRILHEAGILGDEDRIQPIWLSARVKTLIAEEDPKDLLIFPGSGR